MAATLGLADLLADGPRTADANGVVNLTVAQHEVFVLTTIRLG